MSIIIGADPYRQPSFSLSHRVFRGLWGVVYLVLFRPSPRPLHWWRALLLRMFGAKLGRGCHVYPGARIWAPWNLRLGNFVGVGDGANLYSMDRIDIGDFAVISQGAYLCGGTHDYNSPNFQLIVRPITVGAHAWICADAFLHPGTQVPNGAVLGARAVAMGVLPDSWSVYAGHPCRKVGQRAQHASSNIQ
jgi:putative colanic acid biosynthesis acetyltransferase WcaF